MKQLICPSTGTVAVADVPVPALADGDILVRLAACGVCGTDLMKVYDPSVAKPVQLGHEIVGVVAESRSQKFQVSERVAVAHHAGDLASHYTTRGSETQDPVFKASNVEPGGFAELIRVPSALVPNTVYRIPDDMSDLRAMFMEPLACCLRALERVPLHAGDTVLLVGVGAIGLLFVPLLVSRGVAVVAVDVREERLALARQWGAADTHLADANDIVASVRSSSQGRGADAVILTAVSNATMGLALDAVRDGGWIVPFGVKPGLVLPVDVWQLYRREVSIVTSYSATPSGLAEAMQLLARDDFAFETMVSHTLSLEDGAKGFDLLHKGQAAKVAITS